MLFGPAFLHQLQESCSPSRSLPSPILLQSQTRHQGLVVEQAVLPPSIQLSPSPPSGSCCTGPLSVADLPSLLPTPSQTGKSTSITHRPKKVSNPTFHTEQGEQWDQGITESLWLDQAAQDDPHLIS